jgi:hypothetical protein
MELGIPWHTICLSIHSSLAISRFAKPMNLVVISTYRSDMIVSWLLYGADFWTFFLILHDFTGLFSTFLQHQGFGNIWPKSGQVWNHQTIRFQMGMGQNHVALVNIKIGGKWMFIP